VTALVSTKLLTKPTDVTELELGGRYWHGALQGSRSRPWQWRYVVLGRLGDDQGLVIRAGAVASWPGHATWYFGLDSATLQVAVTSRGRTHPQLDNLGGAELLLTVCREIYCPRLRLV